MKRLLWAALLAGWIPPLQAGLCTPDAGSALPRHRFELTAGYSPGSPTLIGTVESRRFVMAGFSYSYACWMGRSMSVSFTPGLLPAAILLQPAETLGSGSSAREVPAHAVYGFGITPVGFTAEFGPQRRLYPLTEAAGGVLASTEPVPLSVTNATGLNFLFYFGAALRWKTSSQAAVTFGYRLLHISNAYTTGFNPGVDNGVFYAGYSFAP